MKIKGKSFFIIAALLILLNGSGEAATYQDNVTKCDGITCATPPEKPIKKDSTRTKKVKKNTKHKKAKSKKQTTNLLS